MESFCFQIEGKKSDKDFKDLSYDLKILNVLDSRFTNLLFHRLSVLYADASLDLVQGLPKGILQTRHLLNICHL